MISYTRKLARLPFLQEGGYVNSRVCKPHRIPFNCRRSRIHTYVVTMQSIYVNGINIEGHKYVTFYITIAYSVQAIYNAKGNYLHRFHQEWFTIS